MTLPPWYCPYKIFPWHYRVTVVIPVIDEHEALRVILDLWDAQSVRPYIVLVDTGSESDNLAKILSYRSQNIEVHCLGLNGAHHPVDVPAAAMCVATAVCRTKYMLCTHNDCFPRKRRLIEELIDLCETKSPVVGYAAARPRPYEMPEDTIGHQCLMLDMEKVLSTPYGLDWNTRRQCYLLGMPWGPPSPLFKWAPDVELLPSMCFHAAGIKPHIIGVEKYGGVIIDENLEHVRAYVNSRFNMPPYHVKAQRWMKDAMERGKKRLEKWNKMKPELHIITPCSRPQNLLKLRASIEPLRQWFLVTWYVSVDTTKTKVDDIVAQPDYLISVPVSSCGAAQVNEAIELITGGWVWVLDDDSIVHPDFGEVLAHSISQCPNAGVFVFGQCNADGSHRLDAGPIEFGKVDTAQFVVQRGAIGDARWQQIPGTNITDWPFISQIWEESADRFVFVNRDCTYYNALRPTAGSESPNRKPRSGKPVVRPAALPSSP